MAKASSGQIADPFGPLKEHLAALKAAMEAAASPFRPLNNALDALAEKLKASAEKATTPLKPLTDALDRLGKTWKDALKPVADFRAALVAATQPLRDARAAFDTLTAPVRLFMSLPGKIAGAVGDMASKAAGMLSGPASQLQSFFGRVQGQIAHLVEKIAPGPVLKFNMALDNMYAALGATLIPVLNQFTALAHTIGGALNGLTGQGKMLIAALAAGALGMTLFAGAALAVEAALTAGIAPILSAISGAVVGAFGGMALASGQLQAAFEPVVKIFAGVANRLGAVLAGFAGGDAFATLAEAFAEVAGVVIDLGASLLDYLMPAFNAASQFAKALAPAFLPLAGAIALLSGVGPIAALVGGAAVLLAKGFEMAAPYIIATTELVIEFGKKIFDMGRQLLSIFGIDLGNFGTAPRGEIKDPTGLAAKNTSTTDVMSVLRSARESAFKMGTGAQTNYPQQTATGVKNLADEVARVKKMIEDGIKELPGKIAKALGDVLRNAPSAAGTAARDVVNSPVGQGILRANPITGPAVLVADGIKYLRDKYG